MKKNTALDNENLEHIFGFINRYLSSLFTSDLMSLDTSIVVQHGQFITSKFNDFGLIPILLILRSDYL